MALVVAAGSVGGKVAAGEVAAEAETAGALVAASKACVEDIAVIEGGSSEGVGGAVVSRLLEQARASNASEINTSSGRFFNTCKVIRIKPLSA